MKSRKLRLWTLPLPQPRHQHLGPYRLPRSLSRRRRRPPGWTPRSSELPNHGVFPHSPPCPMLPALVRPPCASPVSQNSPWLPIHLRRTRSVAAIFRSLASRRAFQGRRSARCGSRPSARPLKSVHRLDSLRWGRDGRRGNQGKFGPRPSSELRSRRVCSMLHWRLARRLLRQPLLSGVLLK